jgi:hypothetical protein
MDEIFPDKRNLIGLVEQASEGKLCLPEFQRDFVWTRNEGQVPTTLDNRASDTLVVERAVHVPGY